MLGGFNVGSLLVGSRVRSTLGVQLLARIVRRMVALGNPSVPAESKPLRNLAHARSASFQLASKFGL